MQSRAPFLTSIFASALIVAPMLVFGQTAPSATSPPEPAVPAPAARLSDAVPFGVALARPTLPTSAAAHLRTSRIVGSSVYNDAGSSIGTVDDLILGTGPTGVSAVLSIGTFLGMGGHLVVVSLNDLRYNEETSRWTLPGGTRETLQALPVFNYERSN